MGLFVQKAGGPNRQIENLPNQGFASLKITDSARQCKGVG